MKKSDTPQPLPHSVSKQQLIAMYRDQMSVRDIKININTIILSNRKPLSSHNEKTDREIIATPKIWHKELMEFIDINGVPEGYFIPEKLKA